MIKDVQQVLPIPEQSWFFGLDALHVYGPPNWPSARDSKDIHE
jgi:hypothetical protein